MNINNLINELIDYGLNKSILDQLDLSYTINVLIDLFKIKDFERFRENPREIDDILEDMAQYAYQNNIIDSNDVITIDNFKAKIVDTIIDKPKEVIEKFYKLFKEKPNYATDYLYKLSIDTNYIQTKRIAQNIKWNYVTEYGKIELTVNLSKPEKDPKLIAMQKTSVSGYPKCQLCKENEGYRGHIGYDSKSNMRIIPIKLNNENWYFQYSPYSYFNEHSIVLNEKHIPMDINKNTFVKLLDFLDYFPDYFIGSNAGLPIVGGSILNHEHYQSGKYRFPIEDAKEVFVERVNEVDTFKVNWPLSTIRLKSKKREKLIDLASFFLTNWVEYQNIELSIINENGNIHNTITPISRKEKDIYVFDLILRNNYCNEEYPDGVFHPHTTRYHIKKENIGLIEAMGLGILPARLKLEFELIVQYLQGNKELYNDARLLKHQTWIDEIEKLYNKKVNPNTFILEEAAKVFSLVLKDAGVFKMDENGQTQFLNFIKVVLRNYQ